MEITKLATQTRNPNRINLYVDGKFYRGLDKIIAFKLGLKPGLTLTPPLIARLDEHQTANTAWEFSLRSLQRSPKSIAMMRRKLKEKFDEGTADQTIRQLQSGGLLDDTALATTLTASYLSAGRRSRKQIWALLKTKQLSDAAIKSALTQIDDQQEVNAAAALAIIKNRQWRALPWRDRYQKIVGYLSQRGFGYTVIKQAADRNRLEAEETA